MYKRLYVACDAYNVYYMSFCRMILMSALQDWDELTW